MNTEENSSAKNDSGSKPVSSGRRIRMSPEELRSRAISDILSDSLKSGVSGAISMMIQVSSLMWMRTIMNNQYRYGGKISETVKRLYGEGKIRRFYRGYSVALLQGPLSRFGDTFSNTLTLSLLEKNEYTRGFPVFFKTFTASVFAGTFRIFFVPIDTVKTILQVEGAKGLGILAEKFRLGGIPVFYHGAIATSAATLVGHYPWFLTYNLLNKWLPKYDENPKKLMRQAFMGFTSSIISDTCSNSLRVIKTTKQTNSVPIKYQDAVKMILEKDGVKGLFGRGLKMRIMTNGVQGLMFSVLWKYFEDLLGVDK